MPIVLESVVVEDVNVEPPGRTPASVSWDCSVCGDRFRDGARYLITVHNLRGTAARRRSVVCRSCARRAARSADRSDIGVPVP